MHATNFVLLGLSGRVWLALVLLLALGLFAYILAKRVQIVLAAKRPEDHFGEWGKRIAHTLAYFLGQKGLLREPLPGLMHALIFWGFLIYAVRTITLFASGFDPRLNIPVNPLGNVYFVTKDTFALLVSLGCFYWLYERLIKKLPRLTPSGKAIFILGLILLLMVTDLLIDGSLIAYEGENPRGAWAYASQATAWALTGLGLSPGALQALYYASWWVHVLAILVFLNYLPLGKHFHVITAIFNVFFYKTRPQGHMKRLDVEGAFERDEVLGLQTIRELSWKDVLDLFSCTECGRCQAVCPAHNSGKILSPKEIILELRDHAYREIPVLGKPKEPQDVVPLSVKPEEIWACTTCMACVEACPLNINQLDKILEMRRNEVMMKDQYPEFFVEVFKGLDGRGNPWNLTPDQRLEWTRGLEAPAPTLSELQAQGANPVGDHIDYLFWVGCAVAFEPRNQRAARALMRVLHEAGVKVAILGEEESCTGDPARRIGHEYIFQIQAERNVETLNRYGVRRILTMCPHCYNTFKHEYPDFGGHYEVVHHTQLIDDLVRQGKLKLTNELRRRIVYHDSCYLGRYNGVYDPQRRAIDAIPGAERAEIQRSRSKGMCCGAGGGLMWVEEEPGKRVNERRVDQLLEAKPDVIATSCPFCMIMMEDAVKSRDVDVESKDVAELIAEALSAH
jgi:Fe-S oxidoreductase/nitrate reductase gamma subunit